MRHTSALAVTPSQGGSASETRVVTAVRLTLRLSECYGAAMIGSFKMTHRKAIAVVASIAATAAGQAAAATVSTLPSADQPVSLAQADVQPPVVRPSALPPPLRPPVRPPSRR